jgi:hypothetical protein
MASTLAPMREHFAGKMHRFPKPDASPRFVRMILSAVRPIHLVDWIAGVDSMFRAGGATAAIRALAGIVRRWSLRIVPDYVRTTPLRSAAEEQIEAHVARAEYQATAARALDDGQLEPREVIALDEARVRAELEESDLYRFTTN